MDKIGGAIKRIDDPNVFIVVMQVGRRAGLFGQDGMVGVGLGQYIDDCPFGGLIDFGDKIVMTFVRHA